MPCSCCHLAGSRGALYGAPSQENLISRGKKPGTLVRSPSKESVNSMGSFGSDSSSFTGGQSKFAEVFRLVILWLVVKSRSYTMLSQKIVPHLCGYFGGAVDSIISFFFNTAA